MMPSDGNGGNAPETPVDIAVGNNNAAPAAPAEPSDAPERASQAQSPTVETATSAPPVLVNEPIAYLEQLSVALSAETPTVPSIGLDTLAHLAETANPVITQFFLAWKEPHQQQQRAALALAYLETAAKAISIGVQAHDAAEAHGMAALQQIQRMQHLRLVVQTVGISATVLGAQPSTRFHITRSGIIAVLAHVLLNVEKDPEHHLSFVAVEFLQCCVLAGHYRYAARIIDGTWPRPTQLGVMAFEMPDPTGTTASGAANKTIEQLVRYYLLRGMIHIGCNDMQSAHKCFWTCLSVPSEQVSAVQLAAWKKLVLVQCLLYVPDSRHISTEDTLAKSSASNTIATETTLVPKQPSNIGLGGSGGAAAAGHLGTKELMRLPQGISHGFQLLLNNHREEKKQEQSSDSSSSDIASSVPAGQPSRTAARPVLRPEYTSIHVYYKIGKAVAMQNYKYLKTIRRQYRELLERDGNLGLMDQLTTKSLHWQIFHIADIYAVIPLDDLRGVLREIEADGPVDGQAVDVATTAELSPSLSNDALLSLLCASGVGFQLEQDGFVVFSDEAEQKRRIIQQFSPQIPFADLVKMMKLVDRRAVVSTNAASASAMEATPDASTTAMPIETTAPAV